MRHVQRRRDLMPASEQLPGMIYAHRAATRASCCTRVPGREQLRPPLSGLNLQRRGWCPSQSEVNSSEVYCSCLGDEVILQAHLAPALVAMHGGLVVGCVVVLTGVNVGHGVCSISRADPTGVA